MSRYNHLFASRFSGCPVLAKGFDPYRNTEVEIVKINGETEVFGVRDNCDCWIAPAIVASDLFEKARKNLATLMAGGQVQLSSSRVELIEEQPQPRKTTRVRLQAEF